MTDDYTPLSQIAQVDLEAELDRRRCDSIGHPPDLLLVDTGSETTGAVCSCGQVQYRIERLS